MDVPHDLAEVEVEVGSETPLLRLAGGGEAVRDVQQRLARDAAEVRAVAAGLRLVDERDGPPGLACGAGCGQAGRAGAQHEQFVVAHRRSCPCSTAR